MNQTVVEIYRYGWTMETSMPPSIACLCSGEEENGGESIADILMLLSGREMEVVSLPSPEALRTDTLWCLL